MRRRKSCRCGKCRRIRWPWLWPLAILFALLQLAAFLADLYDAVLYSSPLVAGLWMGCCCAANDCGPCCRDRGCVSEFVELQIVSVTGDGGIFTCSPQCSTIFADWLEMTESGTPGAETCAWSQNRDCTEPKPPWNVDAGVMLFFSQQRYECTGSVVPTPGQCWLTLIVTGDSTTSGQPNSGDWMAIWEKQILGPYPTDCEGMHTLNFKCSSGFVLCEFSTSAAAVNFVFNGPCDPTPTFDPWSEDVDYVFESPCADVNGVTGTLTNDANLTSIPPTQRWEGFNIGNGTIWRVDAELEWDHAACEYRLTLTPIGGNDCTLTGGSQSQLASSRSCDLFELLFEFFEFTDDPVTGPCPCGPFDRGFSVRITEQ